MFFFFHENIFNINKCIYKKYVANEQIDIGCNELNKMCFVFVVVGFVELQPFLSSLAPIFHSASIVTGVFCCCCCMYAHICVVKFCAQFST